MKQINLSFIIYALMQVLISCNSQTNQDTTTAESTNIEESTHSKESNTADSDIQQDTITEYDYYK